MEAAACYIGECANPDLDAKVAMNLEGGYGVFIYTLVPIAFIVVLGAKALSNSALSDPKTIFITFAGKVFPGVAGQALDWIIAAMLIVALALSALNAIMGSGRALYQMALDGEFPTWFTQLNAHGVPARAMAFNIVCSLLVVLAGGAVEIYSFSNVGYTISFIPVLVGYFLLRQDKPDAASTVQTARIHEICRSAFSCGLLRDLAVWRPLVFEARQCRNLLLGRVGHATRLPAVLLVPQIRRQT